MGTALDSLPLVWCDTGGQMAERVETRGRSSVLLVTGFFDRLLTTVIRKYTDLLASFLAAEQDVFELQIWKEAEGSLPPIIRRRPLGDFRVQSA